VILSYLVSFIQNSDEVPRKPGRPLEFFCEFVKGDSIIFILVELSYYLKDKELALSFENI
jgi:hypothetical protein